ncbi:MAG: sugar phosphate isomerase/epimerase [Bryobacter sp.]|nr:sugar phosphate isomerase/epimerase [Bryobacter sp.]
MFLALHSSIVLNRVKWPEIAELAHFVGFAGVDIPTGTAVSEGAAKTRDVLAKNNIKPAVLGLPVEFRKDDATFEKDLANLEPAAKVAAEIGCPRMATWLMPSSDRPKDEQRALLKKRLGACAAVLEKHKVRLGFENVSPLVLRKRQPYEFIWKTDEMLAFAKECGPNCGLLLDCWHWHHAEGTVQDILNAGRSGIVHVHINDAPNLPPEKIVDSERLMPGEGVIDLKGFLGALKKIGYTDAVSVEVFGRGLKEMDPTRAAQLAFDTANAVFKKAGV